MPRLARLFAQALVILGLAPVAYAIGLVAWQAATWVETRAWVALPGRRLVEPAALQAPALAGWAVISLGRALAARQADTIEWQERQRADRLRRAAQYRV